MSESTSTIGLVLAAGASTRMGQPKALLPGPDGRALAAAQAARLRAAGCAETVIVLGADAEIIGRALTGEAVITNPDWKQGRCTSVQAGLRARSHADGYLILPVDNALVRTATLHELLAAVCPGDAVTRPWFGAVPGRVIWLAARVAGRVLAAAAGTRLDDLLRPLERRVLVADPGVTSNVDSPADWSAVRMALAKWDLDW